MLALLYRVNAEDDVWVLELVEIELLQLLEVIELALEATCHPLRVLPGDMLRFSLLL